MPQRVLIVPDKADCVFNYHRIRRVSLTEIRLFSQLHSFLEEGELLAGASDRDFYGSARRLARAESFELAAC